MERQQLTRLKPLVIFFVAFTVGFLFFAATLKYTFPFLAGFLLALTVQPLIRTMKNRLHFRPWIASSLSTLLVFAVLFGLIFLLGYWLVLEINNLIDYMAKLSSSGFGDLTAPINSIFNQIGDYLSKIDASFIEKNREQLMSAVQSGASIATKILGGTLKFLTSLPMVFTLLIVMIFSTYFFSKDMSVIKRYVVAYLPDKAAAGLRTASKHGVNMSGRYVLSYL